MASKAQIKRNKKQFSIQNNQKKEELRKIELESELEIKRKKEAYIPYVLPTENILPDDYSV